MKIWEMAFAISSAVTGSLGEGGQRRFRRGVIDTTLSVSAIAEAEKRKEEFE